MSERRGSKRSADADRLWRVSEVSELAALSVSTVWTLIRTSAIPSVHVGRSRRVRSSDLAAWMESLATVETVSNQKAAPEVEPGTADEGGTRDAAPSG
jgi:excisionase family DNA binding protein